MNERKGFLSISDAPFLRFLLPYSAGITLQFAVGGPMIPAISAVAAAFFLIRYYAILTPRYKYAKSRYFGYAVFAIFLLAGSLNILLHERKSDAVPPVSARTAVAKITDTPTEKERSIQCRVNMLQFVKQNGEKVESDMPAILFLQHDSLSSLLKYGDIIIFKENLQPISGNSNPYGFDYEKMMRQKGYVYSQYVPTGSWKRIGHADDGALHAKAKRLREKVVERIESLGLQYRSEALLKALLAGETSQITQSMRNSFSVAGLAHILAVSGLHTGIIACIIYLLLAPLKHVGLTRLVPALCIAGTWIYIFVTGMPPSAVRASIMATFVLFGGIIGRKGTTVNAIFASAFIMLLYNPYYIFDVGFQLSYTAVFSIFYLYPLLVSHLPKGNGFSRRISSAVAVTAAAQAGTLPLCLYYFHQLPLLGIFSNMIVIPALPLVMILAIITVITKSWIAIYLLDLLLSGLNRLAVLIESLPFSSIDGIYVKPGHVIFLLTAIFCTAWGIRTKRSGVIAGISCFVFVFVFVECAGMMKGRGKYTFAVYDDNEITAINMASPWYNYIVTPGITSGEEDVMDMAGTFWVANLMPDASFVSDSIKDRGLVIALPYMVLGEEKILVLDSDRFGTCTPPKKKLSVDIAVITWGFDGDFSRICEFFDIGEVIIASNVPWYIRNKVLKECDILKISCYDVKREGAYVARFGIRNRP